MKSTINKMFLFTGILIFSFGCIPQRQYEDVKKKKEQCEEERAQLKTEKQSLEEKNKDLSESIRKMTRQIEGLVSDTSIMSNSLSKLNTNYEQLDKTYELLLQKNQQMLNNSTDETQKMLSKLTAAQADLQRREDEVKKMERDIEIKRLEMEDLSNKYSSSKEEIAAKDAKLLELQSILSKKDSVVNALKTRVSAALLGFENKGLTITQRNGKVYVSLDESLLFSSGSTTVDAKGQEALRNLAKVLEASDDVNVMIEGHTDDVPYKSGGGAIKDNWDLSVLRATSIIRILTENSKINPKLLTAAGRGEYMPIDGTKTKEARTKNRRTEIILTPKLDDLFKIIESN
ncbi:MAG: hypothetical protein A2X12_09485 [Bacteroidetes bacterium GWE2_29_8]|nr:MAG: hypothetical protein A2X12_09485 [Bacteroidetes bacterium GWE2_29_8]OFY17757.1 MAG: hypothetical protein A2X02_03735 [Bacteroidetes bacterium GWF2_29_10]